MNPIGAEVQTSDWLCGYMDRNGKETNKHT